MAWEEGQIVREGDLLVQIDPAPFQAALDQATANLAQDEASLTNAKQDLQRTAVLSRQGNAGQLGRGQFIMRLRVTPKGAYRVRTSDCGAY